MFSNVFLAMTGGELEEFTPKKAAYLACHFSPCGKGLSNLPQNLPEESLLLLDDSMPPNGHDPNTVISTLKELADQFSIKAVLLDFQNEKAKETECMASAILQALPCPVAVTEVYARDLGCPVFLSPPPANRSLRRHLAPWLQQGVFLEIAPEHLEITVTEHGSVCRSLPMNTPQNLPLTDSRLHCHYSVSVSKDQAVFTLERTKEDLSALVQEAYQTGVLGAVGLYQELLWL